MTVQEFLTNIPTDEITRRLRLLDQSLMSLHQNGLYVVCNIKYIEIINDNVTLESFKNKVDYLNTSLNTSTSWDTSITTNGFYPSYVSENFFTYNNSVLEKEITEEINRLICDELEPKYLIRSIPKDRLKIKKAKINKCYLINF